jgi:type I restriction enzyme S subunit
MSVKSLFSSTPIHWRVTTLGELAEASGGGIQTGPFGSQLHAADYVDDGIPAIMPKNISVDSILTDDIARVSPEDIERLAKYKVQVGDIVYSRRGDIEKCARITPKENGWLCGTGCLRVRVISRDVSPEYLHAYLCHPLVREWIVRHAIGATMPNLNTSILSALPVVIPSRPEMKVIASLWRVISDKIQLNHQINQTLEQMAQAIFKSWFVDFEPVKAKMEAKKRWYALQPGNEPASPVCYAGEPQPLPDLETYMNLAAMQAISGKNPEQLARMEREQPDQYAQLRATAELFPSAMQDSELGEIPEGWEALPLSDTVELIGGGTPKKSEPSYWNGDICWFSVKDAPCEGNVFVIDTVDKITDAGLKGSSTKLLPVGTTIITARGTVGKLALTGVVTAMNQSCYGVVGSDGSGPYLNYLRLHRAVDTLKRNTHGAVFDTITRATFETVIQAQASLELRQRFDAVVGPMFEAIKSNLHQTRTLTSLRDTLLPKLLSGELTLPGTEEPQTESQDAAHG